MLGGYLSSCSFCRQRITRAKAKINEAGVPGGRFIQGGYTIANAAFGVTRDAWTAELFIDNLADESAAVYVDTQNFTPKVVTNRPRTVGVRFSYDF